MAWLHAKQSHIHRKALKEREREREREALEVFFLANNCTLASFSFLSRMLFVSVMCVCIYVYVDVCVLRRETRRIVPWTVVMCQINLG